MTISLLLADPSESRCCFQFEKVACKPSFLDRRNRPLLGIALRSMPPRIMFSLTWVSITRKERILQLTAGLGEGPGHPLFLRKVFVLLPWLAVQNENA